MLAAALCNRPVTQLLVTACCCAAAAAATAAAAAAAAAADVRLPALDPPGPGAQGVPAQLWAERG